MGKCVHKVSSPKTTVIYTGIQNKYKDYICICGECGKEFIYEKLPEKLRE